MKRVVKKIHFGLFACSMMFFVQAKAQDFEKDMSIMSKSTSSKVFHTKVKVNVYKDDNEQKPLMVYLYEIKKEGDNLYYHIDGSRVLVNNHCTLIIDDENKSVLYTNNKQKKKLDNSILNSADSLSKNYDSVDYRGEKDGVKKYLVYKNNSEIPLSEVYFDVRSKSIKRIIYHYNKQFYPINNLVEIVFDKWGSISGFPAGTFSESKYLKKEKGKYSLIGELSGYELIINEFE